MASQGFKSAPPKGIKLASKCDGNARGQRCSPGKRSFSLAMISQSHASGSSGLEVCAKSVSWLHSRSNSKHGKRKGEMRMKSTSIAWPSERKTEQNSQNRVDIYRHLCIPFETTSIRVMQ